ncbi:MAG: HTTM domain-containing protein [Verrucomicrobiaceae bacterium]|nr:HTTM domain-containing protein [Verrucomicrobiaceae bacterium]
MKKGASWIAAGYRALATADLRSLALLRIALGIVVVSDLVVSWTNVEVFYTDAGVLPRQLLHATCWPGAGAWSLHEWSGEASWQYFLLAIGLLAGVAMTLGWHSRTAVVVTTILWGSLETRNTMIINGADPAIRMLLFWMMFLPTGTVWSIDQLKKGRPASMVVTALPVVCLWIQIGSIYFYSALLKTDHTWTKDFTAVWQVMHADVFARQAAVWLRLFPEVCRSLTQCTVWLELYGPLLLLIPFWTGLFRTIAVVLFIGFHLGIAVTMDIGSFPWAMTSAWCAAIPSYVWSRRKSTPTVATNPLGNAWIRWTRDTACLLCIIYITLWNIRTTAFKRWEKWLPKETNPIGYALRVDQFWTMFAPYPWLDDGWFVLAAKLTDGTEVDLLKPHQEPTEQKPPHSSSDYKDSRWQKYLCNLWMSQHERHRRYLADYLVKKWNREHGVLGQVERWELAYMLERTRKDGKRIEPITKHVVLRSPRPKPAPMPTN